MARGTNKQNTNTGTTNTANFNIRGTLTDVYEGKKNNYLTIKVNGENTNPKTNEPYYSSIKVTASKEIELYDDGTVIDVTGSITSYFDKDVQRTSIILTARNVKPVSNG